MGYPEPEWERAMPVQEVMMRTLRGGLHWFQAAEPLGVEVRTMRRSRKKVGRNGCHALLDHRQHMPSPRLASAEEVERALRLYRERYRGFSVWHFHQIAQREHQVRLSSGWEKNALKPAHRVPRDLARQRFRRRREPRACFGELRHIDGSTHAWFALAMQVRPTIFTGPNDASSRVSHAQVR